MKIKRIVPALERGNELIDDQLLGELVDLRFVHVVGSRTTVKMFREAVFSC